jgi:Putative glycosyl hydrolase domain
VDDYWKLGFGGGKIKKKSIIMGLVLFFGIAILSTSFVTAVEDATDQITTPTDPIQTDQQATCSTETTDPQTTSSTPTDPQTTNSALTDSNQNEFTVSSAPQAAGSPTELPPINQNGVVKAYWIWGSSLGSVNALTLKNQGITDVFILFKGTSGTINYQVLRDAISKFSGTNIRVHAWMIVFKDASYSSGWIDPNNAAYQQKIINIASYLASNVPGLAGIHLDYVRYSGLASVGHAAYQHDGTKVITNFVATLTNVVRGINPMIYLSAAVMPETTNNAHLYGQDYGLLSQYLDFLVPMVYEGNYHANNAWIASTTKYIVQHAINPVTGLPIPVIVGLQNYHGDSNIEMLSADELNADKNTALANGAAGYAIFRYTVPRWSTYTVKIAYKKVRYRKWIKKFRKVKTRRGYRYRVRYVRVWRYKWLYAYKKYGHWIMGS